MPTVMKSKLYLFWFTNFNRHTKFQVEVGGSSVIEKSNLSTEVKYNNERKDP